MFSHFSVKSQQPGSLPARGAAGVRAGGGAAAGRHALVPHPRCPGTDVGQGENVTNSIELSTKFR